MSFNIHSPHCSILGRRQGDTKLTCMEISFWYVMHFTHVSTLKEIEQHSTLGGKRGGRGRDIGRGRVCLFADISDRP